MVGSVEDLPVEDLPAEDLPAEDLPAEGLPAEGQLAQGSPVALRALEELIGPSDLDQIVQAARLRGSHVPS